MEIQRALELLRQYRDEIKRLKTLPPDNNEYVLWKNKVDVVLKDRFGEASEEYNWLRLRLVIKVCEWTEAELQEKYLEDLKVCELGITKILDKYGILGGDDTKPSIKTEQKGAAKSPIQLFDSLQFHSRVIEASRELFKDGHYAQAIFEAFKAVENFVQDKSGLTLYGTNLMETVFNEENPIIKVPEAGYYDKDVQRGFKHLFIGASKGIRNPKAHKEIIQKDPYITLQYLGFASFLLKRIDYWEASVP